MATIITNQARLEYRYGTATATAVSNTATTVLNSRLSVNKTALADCYRAGQNITYIISVTNSNASAALDVVVTDNLGAYSFNGNNITPLSFIGPAQLFINGVFNTNVTPIFNGNGVTFEIESIPANGNAQIIYIAQVNEYARLAVGSEIENTVNVGNDCDCPCDIPSSDSESISVCEYANVRIVKTVCPNPVICGDRIVYTFNIYNYGNIPATDVVLTDTFIPPLENIEVTVDGVLIPSEDYDYINGTLTLPAADSEYEISIPAATFVQNPNTGIVTPTPSSVVITVSGEIGL